MRPENISRTQDAFDRRRFVSGAIVAIRYEFQNLSTQLKLALWFNVRMNFSVAETAELLAIPGNCVKSRAADGMFRMLDAIARRGIVTDSSSLATVLAVLPMERAPASLMRKIERIAAGDDPNGGGSSSRGVLCGRHERPARRIKKVFSRDGNGISIGELRAKSERVRTRTGK